MPTGTWPSTDTLQFAKLTPLEPRLVRKLLTPLTNIMSTTASMSLLYECINGIIQGGILGSDGDVSGSDEIATLCVNKLRGMIMIDGDPNRELSSSTFEVQLLLTSVVKYVALLAFNRIVLTHPFLVSQQEDVILECIDSPDITIRIQALDLVQGMVTSDNLTTVVSRLMKQLKMSVPAKDKASSASPSASPSGGSDDEATEAMTAPSKSKDQTSPLPDNYRVDVIGRILFMCAKENFANIVDFDWYIDVLTQLVRMAPVPRAADPEAAVSSNSRSTGDVSEKIGNELRNVAVKVRAMRSTVVRAAETILAQLNSDAPPGHAIVSTTLKAVCWILGEYAVLLSAPDETLNALIQLLSRTSTPEVTTTALHATAKVFATIAGDETEPWTSQRKSRVSLLMARIVDAFEPYTLHPNLEVQGRAVEFTELLKLTAEATSAQTVSGGHTEQDAPLLLTQAMPSLFKGWELNSVAVGAQRNVPVPGDLDLDEPLHANLNALLSADQTMPSTTDDIDEFEVYYNERPAPTSISSSSAPAITRLAEPADEHVNSYQQPSEDSYLDADIVARRKLERIERNKDDPFYIPSGDRSRGTSTPIHNILNDHNGPDLDIDSIPIMELDLNKLASPTAPTHKPKPKPRQKVVIAADETLDGGDGSGTRSYDSETNADSAAKAKARKLKNSLLQVDSSHIGSFNLEGDPNEDPEREDLEMQRAMKEVERLRLEMQRANERIQVAQGVDAEGTVVASKKAKKKKKVSTAAEPVYDEDGNVVEKPKVKKKKKARAAVVEGEEAQEEDKTGPVEKKKKKKKKVEEEVPQDVLA